MKWRPKNFREALWPVEVFSWFLCLEIIQYPLGQYKIGISIFYAIIKITAYLLAASYFISCAVNASWYGVTESVYFTIIYVNIFIYLVSIIFVWIYRKQRNKIYKEATQIDEMLEVLKVPLDYRSVFITTMQYTGVWVFFSVVLNILGIMWLHKKIDLLTNIVLMFVLQHPIHGNSLNAVLFSLIIDMMGNRYKKINQILSDIVYRSENGSRRWPAMPKINLSGDSSRRNTSPEQNTTYEILRMTRDVHLKLSNLCSDISRISGIQLAMGLTSSFIIVTGLTFNLYVTMITPLTVEQKLFRTIVILSWLITNILIVFNINRICSNTISEWEKTGNIIHELAVLHKNKEYRDEICDFSLQILQNPLSFTACGLMTFGHDLSRAFLGTVTTYVIILVQMSDTPLTI